MSAGLALLAAALEAAVGYPDVIYRVLGHPVSWMGRLIAWADESWNSEEDSPVEQRTRGVVFVLLLVVVALLVGFIVERLCYLLLPQVQVLALLLSAVIASSLIAQRSLYAHVQAVADALGSKGLAAGRESVAAIVGRDTKELDESGVCRAAIESLAESFCDGVVAPIFWMTLLGLPGAVAYKAINTADSMIGHKTWKYVDFGWAAARTDDAVNWPAARLAVLWLALAAAITGLSSRGALVTAWRDARNHESPNAGWPEAAMAGALGVRLMGPRSYNGETVDHGWMGDGRVELKAIDIRTALHLYRFACGVQLVVLAVLVAISWLV
jgi:adenosylcobinamide-phosphate synthase